MRPSELKKATNKERLDIMLTAIDFFDRAMNHMPGISWNDKRTIELWRGQVKKAKELLRKEG